MLPSANLVLCFFLAFISQFVNPVASKRLRIGGRTGCDYNYQIPCGDVTIRYPFRPVDGVGRCGDAIECRDNQSALIKFNGFEYQVMHIDYDNQTARLVPSSLVETDRSNCSYLSKMDNAMDVSPYLYTAANSQITIYYNCSDISVDVQIYFRFSCSAENLESYAFLNDIDIAAYGVSCTNKTRTAVIQSAPDEGGEYLLHRGFEITWANNDPSGGCSRRYMSKAPIQPSMVCLFDNGTSGAPNERTPPPSPTPARFAGDDERRENKKIFTCKQSSNYCW